MRAGIHSIISMMLTLCLGLNASALSEIVNQAIDPIPKLELSPRQDHALSGTVFASSIESMKLVQREEAILGEISEGNIPNFLRELVAVETSITIENTRFNLTFFVTPDYLSIGSDADHLLIPMTPMLAQRVVDQLGGIMPTRKMVDLIWNASDVCKSSK
jgi:hypothetical protein